MKSIITIFVFGLLLQNCSEVSRNSRAKPTEKQWYEGGTLHNGKVRDGKNATKENKLATCGDFAASMDKSVSMDDLLVRATELKACINEATRGIDNVDGSPVTEIAALCMITLGYEKK